MRSLAAIGLVLLSRGSFGSRQSGDVLIEALRQRLTTAEAVAMSKFNSGAPVEDRPRERQVIFAAVHQGVNMGLHADLVERVFAAQIEASKIAQRAFLAKWQGRPKFAHVPNLASEVRPKLDAITPVILKCLRERPYRSDQVLQAGPTDPIYREAWRVAVGPLRRPSRIRIPFRGSQWPSAVLLYERPERRNEPPRTRRTAEGKRALRVGR